MSKNLFSKTYEVNGRTYTDNLPTNARIMFTKEQYIEYEQQKEEIERLNKENTILKQTMSSNSLLINENAFLKERIDKVIEYIDKELFNVNVQENIMLKNELLKIKSMVQGVDKDVSSKEL